MAKDDDGPVAADAQEPGTDGGTFVIRTWFEPGQEPGFRARVTYGESQGGPQGTAAAMHPDEVLRLVEEWLSAQRGGRNGGRNS